MVMATMSSMSGNDQESVKLLLEILSAEFGGGKATVPEQRVYEALKNNGMDSDRAFAELEEELKRATWDTVSTKIKKKPERNSQNGHRDNINYANSRNNSSQAPPPNRGPRGGGPVPRGGGYRAAPNGRDVAPRNDDGYRQRPRQEFAPFSRGGPGGGRGTRPNTVSNGPLSEVQAISGPAPQDEDLQKTGAAPAVQMPLQSAVPQTDAPVPANQWSKGRPRTEAEIPKTVAPAVVEPPVPMPQLREAAPPPPPAAVQQPAPQPAPQPARASGMPAWSNAAQSRSIITESKKAPVQQEQPVPVPAPVAQAPEPVQPTMSQAPAQSVEEVSVSSSFTDMTGLDATFAGMGFNDGGAQSVQSAASAVPESVTQDMSYGAGWSSESAQQPAAQQASVQPQAAQAPAQQPVQQAAQPSHEQQAMQQMAPSQAPQQQVPAQQSAQAQVAQMPAQAQGQPQPAEDMYAKDMSYGMVQDYGSFGMDQTAAGGANGRNQGYGGRGGRGQQQQAQNYMGAGMSPMNDQQMPGTAQQWQQQQQAMMQNWMQYPGAYANMGGPPQMFMQYPGYPGYNPMNQMYNNGQGYQGQQGGNMQQHQGGGGGGGGGGKGYNHHHKKQQQYNNNHGGGYGGNSGGYGNSFASQGFTGDASSAASQEYYKSQQQGAANAFQGGAGGFGNMYPPMSNMYAGMAGMDSMAFGQQQGGYSARGSASASSAGAGTQAEMMAAYGAGSSYTGYGEQDSKAAWQ